MSKFLTLVLVPLHTRNILETVRQLLAPYQDDDGPGNSQAKWDYWMIGGLHDGVLTGGLNRVETVDQTYPSGGRLTGRRIPDNQNDAEWLENNQFAVAALPPVADWDDAVRAHAVVTPDGQWHDLWEPKAAGGKRKPEYLQHLLDQHSDCWAIVVMCH